MADFLTTEKERHGKIFAIGFLAICAIFLIVPRQTMIHLQGVQEHWAQQALSTDTVNGIDAHAAHITHGLYDMLGVAACLNSEHAFFRQRCGVAAVGIYTIVWRLTFFFYFLLFVVGVFIAVVYDGLMRRKISRWRYEYPSPTRHYIARNTMGRMVAVLLFFSVLPVPIPPQLLIPWFIVAGFVLHTWMRNLQQRF